MMYTSIEVAAILQTCDTEVEIIKVATAFRVLMHEEKDYRLQQVVRKFSHYRIREIQNFKS